MMERASVDSRASSTHSFPTTTQRPGMDGKPREPVGSKPSRTNFVPTPPEWTHQAFTPLRSTHAYLREPDFGSRSAGTGGFDPPIYCLTPLDIKEVTELEPILETSIIQELPQQLQKTIPSSPSYFRKMLNRVHDFIAYVINWIIWLILTRLKKYF